MSVLKTTAASNFSAVCSFICGQRVCPPFGANARRLESCQEEWRLSEQLGCFVSGDSSPSRPSLMNESVRWGAVDLAYQLHSLCQLLSSQLCFWD